MNLNFDLRVPRLKTELLVQPFLPENCGFIDSVFVPVNIEICGHEQVMLDPAVSKAAEYSIVSSDPVMDISELRSNFYIPIETQCKIVRYELREDRYAPLGETTQWSTFVTVNSTTGIVTVKPGGLYMPNLRGKLTFKFFFVAISRGGSTSARVVILTYQQAAQNKVPYFLTQPQDIEVTVK